MVQGLYYFILFHVWGPQLIDWFRANEPDLHKIKQKEKKLLNPIFLIGKKNVFQPKCQTASQLCNVFPGSLFN